LCLYVEYGDLPALPHPLIRGHLSQKWARLSFGHGGAVLVVQGCGTYFGAEALVRGKPDEQRCGTE
jgi:hypothetical protein